MDHRQFVEPLLAEFPELTDAVADEDGLLHLEMACFARHTQAAIDDNQRETATRCIRFADRVFQHADADVKNAVYVPYLENLFLEDGRKQRAWAIELMSPRLKAGWIAINQYLDDLFAGKKTTPAGIGQLCNPADAKPRP
jgi:hypothetical protein